MFRLFSIFIFILSGSLAFGQDNLVQVLDIDVNGNKHTQTCTIEREISIHVGDQMTFVELTRAVKKSEINLINTKLFNKATINIREIEDGGVQLVVDIEETWYIYPVVIFELADRNFNVWWSEQGRSLERMNLGVRLDHLNLTGHKDQLKMKAQFGYTRKYELQYDFPFLNHSGTWGLSSGILYSSNRELGYRTEENKLVFHKSDDFLYNRFRVTSVAYYRPAYRKYHSFKLEFYHNNVANEITDEFNAEFFNRQKERLKFFVAEYNYDYNGLDHFAYPIDGSYFNIKLRKEGLGIFNDVNLLSASAQYSFFNGLSHRWSHAHSVKGRYQFIRNQPGYYHYTALGYYGDQLRGYEYYVIDGLDYIYTKNHIKYLVWETGWELGNWMFISQFRKPTLKVFLATAADIGYVNSPYFNESHDLGNQLLIGGGPGIHALLFNHFLLKAEYSINAMGEKNLFLHFNASF